MNDSGLKWLDPDDITTIVPDAAGISLSALEPFTSRLFSDSLVAQRLITVGELKISEESALPGSPSTGWGHSVASIVAVLLSGSLANNTPQERRTIRRSQEQLLRAQDAWPDLASTSDRAFLVCADHLPSEYGLPRQLYPSEGPDVLLSQSGFAQLVDRLIDVVSPVPSSVWMSARVGLREALVTILAETFKNTHDHARRDIDNSDIAPSVRGIFARYCSLEQIQKLLVAERRGTLTPAQDFASGFFPRKVPEGVRPPNAPKADGILELSVFDSGPGMAANWLGRSVNGVPVNEQLDAVLSCFAKGQSSTDTLGRGYGLAKVLLRLRELRGFIGVRTNQIHIYRQFGSRIELAHRELSDGTRVPKEILFDWNRPFTQSATQQTAVKGTVVTFLLPMGGE